MSTLLQETPGHPVMGEEIPVEVKRAILEGKLALWRQTIWSLGIDGRAWTIIENRQMQEDVARQLRDALKMIDLLEQELKWLDPTATEPESTAG